MYRCKECDYIFEELMELHTESGCYEADYGVYSDFPDHHYYSSITYQGCPNCRAFEDNIEKVDICDGCERYYPLDGLSNYIEGNFGNICEQCWDKYNIGGN